MTAPSYTEDLTDLSTAESSTGWVEMTGTIGGEAYNAQGSPAGADGDYPFIQGNYSVTQDCSKSTAVGSLAYNNGAGTGGHGTDGAYFVWQNYMVASNIGTYAQGGFQIVVGSGLGDFDAWYVGGVDKAPYPYGGWINSVANTTVTPDGTAGTPTATEQYIGSAVYVATGSSKGEVHNCDVIRYGRGSAIFEYGEAADYCTIAGFATQNDNNSNRWGLIQEVSGGYLWKGRMQLGSASNAVDFRDSDRIIFIQWTPKVTANFNTIEIVNASSRVDMTGFQFICLDTSTASKGRWITTNDADVNLDSCTFQDMNTFTFDSNTTALDCTWKRCGQIDPGGGDISGAFVDESAVATSDGAVYWNDSGDPDTKIDGSTFVKGSNAHHAIEFGTSAPITINLTDMTFSGFNASDGQNDSVLLFPDKGSDTTWTVNHTGTTGTISYKKMRAGDTVNISSSVTTIINTFDKNNDPVANVRCAIYKLSDDTELMNEDSSALGVASENVPYPGSPFDIYWRVRESPAAGNRYKAKSGFGEVTADGFAVTVTMVPETVS
jgi:hypothetical protein